MHICPHCISEWILYAMPFAGVALVWLRLHWPHRR